MLIRDAVAHNPDMNVNPPVVVPDWLLDRFDALYAMPPHYEASYYGPVNMLLTTFFPATMRFLVKPQARIREPPVPGGRTSNDSYGQTVGTSDKDGNPDFLVSTGTAALDSDVPFLIYEVKPGEEDEIESQVQMERYMQWARQYQRQVAAWAPAEVFAVLVLGARSQIYELHADAIFTSTEPRYGTTSETIQNLLQTLRTSRGS